MEPIISQGQPIPVLENLFHYFVTALFQSAAFRIFEFYNDSCLLFRDLYKDILYPSPDSAFERTIQVSLLLRSPVRIP